MSGYNGYNMPSTTTVTSGGVLEGEQPGGLGIAEEDEAFFHADVKWKGVAKPMRLGRITVMCMIFNRMIGTGIFKTPAFVFENTKSVGVSMAWWILGAIAAMSGILVYMELGLTLPLYRFGGKDVSVPRSGGELNYLKYMFKRPAFFTTCVFGLTFILLANVATNSIAFATCILDASGQSGLQNHDAIVRAIAVAVAASTCLIHGTWRQGGIYLNNLLAAFKIAILLLIFILAMLAYGGVFKRPAEAVSNLAISQTFKGGTTDPHAMADSFLSILFAFGGFNQANYVIGEVDDPRRRYKWPAFSAVAIVSLLYIIVNVAYFVVVPTDEFSSGLSNNVAHSLFKVTLGSLSDDWLIRAPRMLSALMAVSALGNIIVMTYTAARVKQEIAKEGILPLRRFLAGSVPSFRIPIRKLWGSNLETLPEDVPLGALVLHFTLSTVLILATWSLTTLTTYSLLVDLYSYSIDAIFGTAIGFGLLYMRFLSGRRWSEHSKASGFRVLPIVSFFSALIFGIANLYPVAAKWVPPNSALSLPVPWFTVAAVGWSILVFGVFWWIGFRFVIPHIGRSHTDRQLLITRKLWFHQEHGYKVLEYEDIDFRWVLREDENERGNMLERTFFAEEHEVTARMQEEGQHALRN